MTIRKPEVDITIIPDYQKEENAEQMVLFVGQKTAAGTATSGQLYQSLGNANEQDTLFGKTSALAAMVRAAKNINKITRFDAIPLSDSGTGVAATGEIKFTGTASAAGTITVTIGSAINHQYTLTVANLETATVIGAALVAAMTADTTIPVVGVNTSGTVAITVDNKGTYGNGITLKVDGTVAGITYTITGMASGANDPVLTSIFDVVGSLRYQTIIQPGTFVSTEVKNFLEPRFNSSNNILDGVCIISVTHDYSTHISVLAADNQKSFAQHCNLKINDTHHKGSALLELDDVIASQIGAIRALRLTQDADISRYVISPYGIRDNFGGPRIASKPYFNTPFYNLPLIDVQHEFTDIQMTTLNAAGGFVLGNNRSHSSIILGEVVTTYKTDAASNEDITFKYLNYVDTASNIREYFFNNLKERFAQSRLTEGDVVPNVDMANAGIIAAFLDGLYNDLSGEDYVLTQAGETARKFFAAHRTVTLDLALGKATVSMMVPIVTQLRKIVVSMQIAFSTNS